MLLGTLLTGLLTAACDNTFEPIAPGGPPYSIFGYLDASADTQWIRVNRLRTVLLASPRPTGIRVTLENLGTGAIIELRDSAVRSANMIGSDSVFAHDFWTTEQIEPGASYRFLARGPDTAFAETVVAIPRDYELELWISQRLITDPGGGVAGGTNLWISGLKLIPFTILQIYYYDDCVQSGFVRHVQPMDTGGDSTRLVRPPSHSIDNAPACGKATITKQEVEVVGSAAKWPFGQDYSTWKLNAQDQPSNVGNSLGFLGGVLTKWIRLESCAFAYPSDTERYCKLRYDSTTATLRGTVTTGCPTADSIAIQLRELEPRPPDPPRIRTARHTDRSGNFEIGALQPGIPHELLIFAGDTTNVGTPTQFQVFRDTLKFTPGQTVTYSAFLRPVGPCAR